jgi:hypothetical protein
VVAKDTPPMDAHTAEITIEVYFKQMRERLERAVSIARAAETCADAGNVEKGIEVALDVEKSVYEVNTFLNEASTINRLGKT